MTFTGNYFFLKEIMETVTLHEILNYSIFFFLFFQYKNVEEDIGSSFRHRHWILANRRF